MSVLVGRLDRETARAILEECSACPADELSARLPIRPESITYSSVGGTRMSEEDLEALRRGMLTVAREHGYPGPPKRIAALESQMARILHRALPMTASEAAQEEVWTYLTCCWLLDLAVWRFGMHADERRFIGNLNRNTFRRLWWRAEILGPDVPLDALGEDELVSIMERPTLAADRRLARVIVMEFLANVSTNPSVERMQLMREAMKRLMRVTPFISFLALPDREVSNVVRTSFAAATASLSGAEFASPEEQRPMIPAPSPHVIRIEATTIGAKDDMAATPQTDDNNDEAAATAAIAIAERTGAVTNIMLRETTSLSAGEARAVLMGLVEMGVLARRGVRRGTHYVIARPGDGAAEGRRSAEDGETAPSSSTSRAAGERVASERQSDEGPPSPTAPKPGPPDQINSGVRDAPPPSERPRRRPSATDRLDRIGVLVGGAVSKRRTPSMAQSEQVLATLQQTPGIDIPEIAMKTRLNIAHLYGILPRLESEGKVTKAGRFWHPRYSLDVADRRRS